MGKNESAAGLAGVVGVMGLCCGLPLLASAGALGAIAGMGLGSWFLVIAGAAVAVFGVVRWRQSSAACEMPASAHATSLQGELDDRTV